MKKVISLICLIGLISPITTFAQSASPSGILNSVKEKVAAELSQIKLGVAKKGFVGSVTSKSDAVFKITTLNNETRTATVSTDTVIKLSNNKDGTIADLKTNDFVIAMGEVDSENNMTVKRLLVLVSPPSDKRLTTLGTVTKTSSSTFTIKTTADKVLDIKVSAGTKYNDKFKLSDLKTDSKVIVVALTGGTSTAPTYSALRIYLIQ